MAKGRKIFAQINIKDGEIAVDFGNTTGYEVVKLDDGTVCIVSRKHEEFHELN